MDTSQQNINDLDKYKATLKSTWNKLLQNKQEVGISIYQSIVLDTTMRRNGTAKATSIIFENTNLTQQSSQFMNMLGTVISLSKYLTK